MNICFEITALFHSAILRGKKRGNFKMNKHLDSVESFLSCLCSSSLLQLSWHIKHAQLLHSSKFMTFILMKSSLVIQCEKFLTRLISIHSPIMKHLAYKIYTKWKFSMKPVPIKWSPFRAFLRASKTTNFKYLWIIHFLTFFKARVLFGWFEQKL